MKYILFILLFSTLAQDTNTKYCDDLIAKGIDALYNKEHTESLELLTEAKSLAQANDWYDQLFISTNCIGLNYYQMLDYGEALDNYLEAYTIAIKNLNPEKEMTVLNNIALVYLQESKFKESEKHQKRAFDIAIAAKDTLKIGMYAGNLASIYVETKQLNEASKYIDLAKSLNLTDIRVLMQVYNVEAESYIAKKEYGNAQKIIDLIQGQLNLREFNDNKIAVYLMLSKIYESQHNIEEAIKITQKARADNLTFNNNVGIYNRFSTLFALKGEHNKALMYKDSVIIAKDSLNAIKNQALYQNSKIKLELQDYQKELNISEEKLNNEKRIRHYLIGFTILIVSLLGWLLRSNYIKYKQKRIIAERS